MKPLMHEGLQPHVHAQGERPKGRKTKHNRQRGSPALKTFRQACRLPGRLMERVWTRTKRRSEPRQAGQVANIPHRHSPHG
jgi:hypothetical protein